MKKVIRFQTMDGFLFEDEEVATEHEKICEKIKAIDDILGPIRPMHMYECVQHDYEDVRKAKEMAFALCGEILYIDETYSTIENFMDDVFRQYTFPTLQDLFKRFKCMSNAVEYSDPLFTLWRNRQGVEFKELTTNQMVKKIF